MGFVRVAFCAFYVDSQCSWALVQNCLEPVEIPQVQFLDIGDLPVQVEGQVSQ